MAEEDPDGYYADRIEESFLPEGLSFLHDIADESGFSFEEVIERLKKGFEPIRCDRCEKCVCPYGHEIHTILRQYNYYNLGKEFWAINKLKMDIDNCYKHCKSCTNQVCMKNCSRNLYIPEEIEKVYKLVHAFGKV